jgi:hypothetical protein
MSVTTRNGSPAFPSRRDAAKPTNANFANARDGCINCHGAKGRGSVPDPQSPDKTIPAFGADFFKEFNTDRRLRR